MRVELITSLDRLEPWIAAWRRLAQRRPFAGPDWLVTWWRHLGVRLNPEARLFVVALVDESDKLIALAPWCIEPSLMHGRSLRFLGWGDVCSDYVTIPCQAGYEAEVSQALADWLCGNGPEGPGSDRWDLLSLENVDLSDPVLHNLVDAFCERGAITHLRPAADCWRLQLPASWDEYLAALSKSHRKQLRRLERAYLHTSRAELIPTRTPDQLAESFGLLVDLHNRRWADRGLEGVFASPELYAFHREATERLLTSGHLRLSWLELDGQPVAAEYSLVGGNIIFAYQSGMDPRAAEHDPGSIALVCILQDAIADGATSIDFLRGNEPYKRHWRAQPRPMHDVRILPGHWPGRLRQSLWQAASGAKDWLRAGRDAVLGAARGAEAEH